LMIIVREQMWRVNKMLEEMHEAVAGRKMSINFAEGKNMETARYVNDYNNEISRTKSVEISLANIQALRNTERLAHLKQFEGLKKKLNNLMESISIDAEIDEDSIPVVIRYVPCKDSVRVFHYHLVDEFNTISAMVVDTPKFEIKVPLRSAVFWQRKRKILWWRMGKKEYSIESWSPNKLVEIKEQELMRIQKR